MNFPTTADLDALLEIAHSAIDLAEACARATPQRAFTKGDRDMVTEIDLTIEHRVRDALAQRARHIPFLGEECGGTNAPTRWVLDPIDGTANHLRTSPLHGISLALIHHHQPSLAVVSHPALGHRYWAAIGRGAWRDGRRVQAARTSTLHSAMIGIGDYGTGPGSETRNHAAIALHAYLAPRTQRIRMLGSAAIDLAWVADGRLDASITLGNREWDMAAGVLIAREAGAAVLDLDGTDHTQASRCTLAIAPALSDQLLAAIHHTLTDQPDQDERAEAAC